MRRRDYCSRDLPGMRARAALVGFTKLPHLKAAFRMNGHTSANFGKLTLLPIAQLCATVPRQGSRTFILSNLKPGATVQWEEQEKEEKRTADASGLVSGFRRNHG